MLEFVKAVGGLALLVVAADRMVLASVRVSRSLGVSAILIGAVIVGFGTSVPEFFVSAVAALRGNLDLAMSNVVSSNTANVTLVLGAAAVLVPVVTRRRTIRREGFAMFGAVVALALALAGGAAERWQGFLLLGLLGLSTWAIGRWAATDEDAILGRVDDGGSGSDPARGAVGWRAFVAREIVIGLVALVVTLVAADLLVDGAVAVGARLGLSGAFLGFLAGVGTSLPELSAALAAARRRESDLILGNVLGSNLFNSLGVAGLAATLGPGALHDVTIPILLAMVGTCFVAGWFATSGQRIVRAEGILLLVAFGAYAVLVY